MDEHKNGWASDGPSVIVPPVVAALCALIGVANLAGWIGGARILVSVAPGLPSMVPVTTILALLAAAGLWVHWRWPGRTGLGRVFPALAIALCSAIGICYLAGAAPEPFRLAQSGHESPASLPSPVTAFMFFLLGSALLLSAAGTRIMVAQGTALAVCMLAVLNLGGYLFRDTVLYQFLPGRGTSILTTVQAILLALGILFAHPRRGLMAAVTGDLPGAAVSRRLLISAFVVPIAAGTIAVIAAHHGLHDSGTTLPLFVWTMIVLFLLIMWRFALRLSSADVARCNAERELQGALRDLRAEQDRKDRFLATLAHELRNPLAPIAAAAEVLRQGGGQRMEDRQRIGGIVAAQAGNLVHLVNDLLDIERLSSGRIALDRHVLDLRTQVAGALEQARPLIARKEHTCRVDLPPEPVHVCGDAKRLVQILSNLLNNSAKYTPAGGTITVHLATRGECAVVTVEDNGIGIAGDMLAHVFDPYSQAALTPDRTEGGLGIGLSLVKRLTELHGGSATAASPGAGKGSTFTVVLPLMPSSPLHATHAYSSLQIDDNR